MTRRFLLSTVVVGIILCRGLLAQSDSQAAIEDFATKYKHAASEQEKLRMVISAIDRGLIYVRCRVDRLDQLFGTDYAHHLPTAKQQTDFGVVDFGKVMSSGSDTVAGDHVGWYLAFKYDNDGVVRDYYLTNIYK